jgi:hypothetical protein
VTDAFAVKKHIGFGGDAHRVDFFCGHGVDFGCEYKTADFRGRAAPSESDRLAFKNKSRLT